MVGQEEHGPSDARHLDVDDVHVLVARGDAALVCRVGVAEVVHRVNRALVTADHQQDGQPDQPQAPGSTAPEGESGKEEQPDERPYRCGVVRGGVGYPG